MIVDEAHSKEEKADTWEEKGKKIKLIYNPNFNV